MIWINYEMTQYSIYPFLTEWISEWIREPISTSSSGKIAPSVARFYYCCIQKGLEFPKERGAYFYISKKTSLHFFELSLLRMSLRKASILLSFNPMVWRLFLAQLHSRYMTVSDCGCDMIRKSCVLKKSS